MGIHVLGGDCVVELVETFYIKRPRKQMCMAFEMLGPSLLDLVIDHGYKVSFASDYHAYMPLLSPGTPVASLKKFLHNPNCTLHNIIVLRHNRHHDNRSADVENDEPAVVAGDLRACGQINHTTRSQVCNTGVSYQKILLDAHDAARA
jgi:hypothetical protein